MRIVFLFLFLFSSLSFAQKVFCYKKDMASNEADPFMALEGKECKGVHSVEYMESNGWKLSETKISKVKGKYTHFYLFEKKEPLKAESLSVESKKPALIDLSQKELTITMIDSETAKIAKGGLKIGQSGIIINKNEQEDIILGLASVVKSGKKESIIKIQDKNIFEQDAIPDTNLEPSNGDIFVLNHLYSSSLLLVPNNEAKQIIKDVYKNHFFIGEDFFAADMKLKEKKFPTKDLIVEFCRLNQIGSVFLVAGDTLFILDGMNFEILAMQDINLNDKKKQIPFFSKIKLIDGDELFDFSLNFNFTEILEDGYSFIEKKKKDYDEYYLKMLGKL